VITEQEIKTKLAENAKQDAAGFQAAAAILPGPLKDAFAVHPEISAGPHKVRPITDGDIVLLAQLNHPLGKMIEDGLTRKQGAAEKEFEIPLRGPLAWQMYWILTHSPDDVETAIKEGALDAFAKDEFSKYQLGAYQVLHKAVLDQLTALYSTAIQFGEIKETGEEAKSTNPPS